jgi:hypothetical protein
MPWNNATQHKRFNVGAYMREKRLAVSHGHKEQRIVGPAKEVGTT